MKTATQLKQNQPVVNDIIIANEECKNHAST